MFHFQNNRGWGWAGLQALIKWIHKVSSEMYDGVGKAREKPDVGSCDI